MQGNYALKFLMTQNILTHDPYIHVLVKFQSMLFALNRLQLLYYVIQY